MERVLAAILCLLMVMPWDLFEALAQSRQSVRTQTEQAARKQEPDRTEMEISQKPDFTPDSTAYLDAEVLVPVDTTQTVVEAENLPYGLDGKKIFNPDPTRAVWMSALFPGLGQIYNRRYWKLPIIVAGFMGLGYGTSWNNGQYQDYTTAYRDILDDDPNTKSYLDFFPPNVDEGSLDKSWLSSVMKSRKDYYRRNRDLCIICIVGVYLLCMVDAYVDASMAHFDISPDVSMDVAPAVLTEPGVGLRRPAFGLNWALTF